MSKKSAARLTGGGRVAARLVIVVGALFGLFAMHALGDHCAASHDTHAAGLARPAASAAGLPHGAHDVIGQAGSTDSATEREPASRTWMAALCLAFLASVVFTVLRATPRRILWEYSPTAGQVLRTSLAALRPRDPPCLFELSIQRC